jgi:hypothetical protein
MIVYMLITEEPITLESLALKMKELPCKAEPKILIELTEYTDDGLQETSRFVELEVEEGCSHPSYITKKDFTKRALNAPESRRIELTAPSLLNLYGLL